MSVITLPTLVPAGVDMQLIRADVPLPNMGGSVVIVAPPYAVWVVTIPLSEQEIGDARLWFAALVQISKLSNTFKVSPPSYTGPSSGYGGAGPLVNGASQLGTSLVCDGCSNGTLIVQAGDFLEINGEFKVVIADATSNGSGQVTINFEPALRAPPADNAPVDITTPELTMRLAKPIAVWSLKPAKIYEITLEAIENF